MLLTVISITQKIKQNNPKASDQVTRDEMALLQGSDGKTL